MQYLLPRRYKNGTSCVNLSEINSADAIGIGFYKLRCLALAFLAYTWVGEYLPQSPKCPRNRIANGRVDLTNFLMSSVIEAETDMKVVSSRSLTNSEPSRCLLLRHNLGKYWLSSEMKRSRALRLSLARIPGKKSTQSIIGLGTYVLVIRQKMPMLMKGPTPRYSQPSLLILWEAFLRKLMK